jgi:tetratricopeptide (TPR) repeat protein
LLGTIYRKTQDALNFVYDFKNTRHVFWVHGGSPAQFEAGYRKIASLVQIQGHEDPKVDIMPKVKEWLEGSDSKDWILVLDNADNKDDFFNEDASEDSTNTETRLASLIPVSDKGSVVVTTRDREVAVLLAGSNIIKKQPMDAQQALQLFHRKYRNSEMPQSSSEDIQVLLAALDYLPLAIVQAASYLTINTTITATEYLEAFRTATGYQRRHLSTSGAQHYSTWSNLDKSTKTILATFSITFRQIQKQSPLANDILRVIACIHRQGIPHGLLEKVRIDDKTSKIQQKEAISKLSNFSILQSTTVDNGKAYEIHALVHVAIQYFLAIEDKMQSALSQTESVFLDALPKGYSYEFWPEWLIYLPHAIALVGNPAEDESSKYSAVICDKVARYLTEDFRYLEALGFAERAMRRLAILLPEESIDLLNATTTAANIYRLLGRYKDAEEFHLTLIAIKKRVLGEEDRRTLDNMEELAFVYRETGRLKQAEELQKKALLAKQKILGDDTPEILRAKENLAATYKMDSRLALAVTLEEQIFTARQNLFGNDHPSTLSSMSSLAWTYTKLGRLREGQRLKEEVLELRKRAFEAGKRILGEEHPNTLHSMQSLAILYKSAGRLVESLEIFEQVFEERKRVLGYEHPDTLHSMELLAISYNSAGRLAESVEIFEQVFEVKKRVLGYEYPDTLHSMELLAISYNSAGRLAESLEIFEQVFEVKKRVLGERHSDTLHSMELLAISYNSAGRLAESVEIFEQVFEVKKRVLGERHSDTLHSMELLAISYNSAGRLAESLEIFEQLFEVRKRVLGEEHPSTLQAAGNVADTKKMVDERLQEAQPDST